MPNTREKLIKLLKRTEYQFTMSHSLTVENVADDLVQQGVTVQEWIPVTERLPEEGGAYIATAWDGHTHRVTFVKWQKRLERWDLTGARSYWKITHWMPLPEPPKGE